MNKYIDFIDLTNKYIFFIVISILVFILSYINNTFFYEYVKIRNYQEIRVLATNLHIDIKKCKSNDIICLNKIWDEINILQPYANIRLFDNDNNLILKYTKVKKRHKNRELISIPKYLNKIENTNLNLSITKETTPSILKATFRGITFSFYEIFIKTNNIGMTKTFIWYINEKIYMRSQNVIVFFILTFLVIYLLRKRQVQLKNKYIAQNLKIINLSKNIEQQETELSELMKMLNSKDIDFLNSIDKYKNLMSPPFDALKYEELLDLDPETIIYKSRKVLEKILAQIYEQEFNTEFHPNLAKMIEELRKKKILSQKTYNYAITIKAFGNIAAHPDYENLCEFTKNDGRVISNALILFIDEIKLRK
ncbi:DUF4145 domain-containing protein [Poseidonibacter lekithochrous]|uniref:DUF4145 domain-containing protein n=1 Tax=Poseidonibacter lekithochrous TaxID=1904463 RepID=UPI000D389157|nr:DUF4145 domain-containing protein [Poseidonibacter lekithochrous]